jgi:transcription antitermination factor NusG
MIWSVAQTETLRERAAQRFLEQSQFETYLPLIGAKNRIVPLFPAYLFVRIGDTGWSRVDNTIGVLQLLRAGDKPAKIADDVINAIRDREHNGVVRLPERPRWQLGDRIRIGKGMFLGHIGLFDGMSARERVFVLLNLFGRQTRAELPVADLQDAG